MRPPLRNSDGRVCGEGHHRAKLPDSIVNWLRTQHETGLYSLQELVERLRPLGYKVPKSTVHAIVTFRIRAYVRPDA